MQRQPVYLPRLSASAHVSAANILTLLIKASATVTVYRGHRRTRFSARDYLPVHHVMAAAILKIIKWPYLSRGFSDFDEIWHDDAV